MTITLGILAIQELAMKEIQLQAILQEALYTQDSGKNISQRFIMLRIRFSLVM